jgi:hypothetical protein
MVFIDRVVGAVNTRGTMSAQVICLTNHHNLSNPSKISIIAEIDEIGSHDLYSTDFSSASIDFGIPDSGEGRRLSQVKKRPTLKKFPSVMKPTDKDSSVNTKVVWDDCASIASLSARSNTEKTTRFDTSRKADGRRSSWRSRTFDSANNKVTRALKKYDEVLHDIILNQSHDMEVPILPPTRRI